MSPAADYYDLGHDDALDLTNQIYRDLGISMPDCSFSATVPPHLTEASVAHWDGVELW